MIGWIPEREKVGLILLLIGFFATLYLWWRL